ncbi:MAG: carboxypeptidase regulatory-like domain-containing protein [Archangium sp.]
MRKLRVFASILLSLVALVGAFVAWRWHQFREDRELRAEDERRAPIVARPLTITTPTLAPGQACITGRVVDADRPVSAMQVSLSAAPPTVSADCPCVAVERSTCMCFEGLDQLRGDPRIGLIEAVQSVTSAADGSFSLCGLADLKPRLVWAEHADGRVAWRTDGPREVSAGTSVLLRVQHRRELEGVVLNDEGPVRGAVIIAMPKPQVTSTVIEAGIDGRFRTSLPNGRHLFVVSAPGYDPMQFSRSLPDDAPLVFRLAPLVDVTVRVEHEGRPVAGATVWRAREPEVTTNVQGLAVLRARRGNDVVVHARRGLLVADATVNATRDQLVVLSLEPGAQLHGLITDEKHAPLVGAKVDIDTLDDALLTDVDGRFVSPPLPPRQLALRVEHDDCLRDSRFVRPTLEPEFSLELRCSASARGMVVDAAGTPVEGATLSLKVGSETEDATTVADGRFAFFSTGTGVVTVTHARYRKTQQPLTLPNTAETTIVLDAAASVSGRVIDADGTPVSRVKVESMPAFDVSAGADDTLRTYTDADGRFELHGLRAGRFGLLATASGHGAVPSEMFVLQPGETREGIEVQLGGRVDIGGVVLDEKNQPVPGAKVVFERPDADEDFRKVVLSYATGDIMSLASWSNASATTDTDGRFELRDVGAASSTLRVYAPGYAPLPATKVSRGQHVELHVKKRRVARGRAVDDEGRPLRSFTADDVTFSDGSGRFEVSDTASVTLKAPGYQQNTVAFDLDEGDVDLGDVTLHRASPLKVTVKSDTGKTVIGVVTIGPNVCRTSAVPWCQFDELPDGDLEVRIAARLHLPETRKVLLVDRAKGLEVTLREAKGRLEGTATIKPGVPAAGLELNVSGVSTASTVTTSDGRFTVAGLDEGAACVTIELSEQMMSRWSAPVVISSSSTPVAIGPMAGGASISVTGVVCVLLAMQGEHPDGAPRSNASRACLETKATTVQVSNFGGARIDGLPPGTWTVWTGDVATGRENVRRHVVQLSAGQTLEL